MKNILVTGGAGFVGSHLCDRLISEGHKVHCVDNLYTGNLNNIEGLSNNPNFIFYNLDVTLNEFRFKFLGKQYTPVLKFHLNLPQDHQVLPPNKFDLIFNLACPASPVHYQRDPVYTFMTNINGAYNVLEIAKNNNCRVVQASTSEVYGDPLVHPQDESYFGNVNTMGSRSCYDEGKRGAETLFYDYRNKYNLDTGVFRIFNTYGPRMAKNDGRVVSNFIVAALSDAPLEIYGEGNQTRSFQYIDDLIDGIIAFAFSKEAGPINLGNPGEFTINELASIIISKVNKGYIVNKEKVADDPKQRKPDISLAEKRLQWKPKIPLTDGLDKTIAYFRRKINEKGQPG